MLAGTQLGGGCLVMPWQVDQKIHGLSMGGFRKWGIPKMIGL